MARLLPPFDTLHERHYGLPIEVNAVYGRTDVHDRLLGGTVLEYPRPMFRTVRSLTILLAVCTSLMFATVTVGSWAAQRSPWEFWPVYLYIVCTPLTITTKTLSVLWEAEQHVREPTQHMNYLFTLALLFPIVAGLIPVGLMMR